ATQMGHSSCLFPEVQRRLYLCVSVSVSVCVCECECECVCVCVCVCDAHLPHAWHQSIEGRDRGLTHSLKRSLQHHNTESVCVCVCVCVCHCGDLLWSVFASLSVFVCALS